MHSWEAVASEKIQGKVLRLFLFNAFVNDLEGRVKSSLIKFTGLLNWEVIMTPWRRKSAEQLRTVKVERNEVDFHM